MNQSHQKAEKICSEILDKINELHLIKEITLNHEALAESAKYFLRLQKALRQ